MFRTFLLISCIILASSTQLGKAATPSTPPPSIDPKKCAESVPKVVVCWTDFWNHLGKLSPACCNALKEIDAACLSSVFPQNPIIGQFFKGICSGSGSGSGAFPFPIPFPFPPVGGGGLPFPFPFPPIGGGGGGLPFPFPPIGGGPTPPSPPPKA